MARLRRYSGVTLVAQAGKGTCEVAGHPLGKTVDGLLDMAGNVSEWTSSPFCPDVRHVDLCKRHGKDMMVVRGGGWMSDEPIHASVRDSQRHYAAKSLDNASTGFRCAKSVTGAEAR